MEKMIALRFLCRAACSRSSHFRHHLAYSRSLFTLSSPSVTSPPKLVGSDFRSPFAMGIGSARSFSEDVSHMPTIKDPEIEDAFKDLMGADWGELPNAVVYGAKNALSKNTDDKSGQEILANVFRAAEAVEEFSDMIMNIKMELDDMIGASGENTKPLPAEFASAIQTIFQRYSAYLDAFGPDEGYLQKKVETELGSKMIYLKMRCGGLDPAWGKVTVLATSGLAGSYIEQRAR